MWSAPIALVLVWAGVAFTAKHQPNSSVCYPPLGCFDNNPPFDNANGNLPNSPEDAGMVMKLFTRQNKQDGSPVEYNNSASLRSARFDPNKSVKVITHGFGGDFHVKWLHEFKDAILVKEDSNVLIVGWKKAAAMPDYFQAVANIRVVAAMVQSVLVAMQDAGANLGNIQLIGHSLGAHLVGDIGRRMGSKLGRITGIDATQPLFEGVSPDARLDETDAMFVDVIHTDGHKLDLMSGGFGLYQPIGHVDFYVNGGKSQPGCHDKDGLIGFTSLLFQRKDLDLGDLINKASSTIACSHSRSTKLFLESITTSCPFTAYPCDNYEKFERGECLDCTNNKCNTLGYLADPSRGRGQLFLDTAVATPFCAFHYGVDIKTNKGTRSIFGTLYMSVTGDKGTSKMVQLTHRYAKLSDDVTKLVIVDKDIGHVTSVSLKYDTYSSGAPLSISKLSVKSGDSGLSTEFCKGPYEVKPNQTVIVQGGVDHCD